MDSYRGRARLEWWANAGTCIDSYPVRLVVDATEDGWDAQAKLARRGDREGLAFLRMADNWFTLRFADGSTFEVTVGEPERRGWFPLTELATAATTPDR